MNAAVEVITDSSTSSDELPAMVFSSNRSSTSQNDSLQLTVNVVFHHKERTFNEIFPNNALVEVSLFIITQPILFTRTSDDGGADRVKGRGEMRGGRGEKRGREEREKGVAGGRIGARGEEREERAGGGGGRRERGEKRKGGEKRKILRARSARRSRREEGDKGVGR